eukprot:CAMPEP_0194033424 /NCGR_PEP_ID=MMETSP0009_2-20130614/6131_1 /TAXON_ID=210454 /ORGANISM="Grammatophora oceanica, Strain CCMP 410" /LENGTH=293 /DNA_ID=CAMNT_0038674117 /DNA_START=45 /DNA_END=926 /DNA_ORIENTATION=+
MRPLLVAAALLTTPVLSSDDAPTECSLACKNGGICELGNAEYGFAAHLQEGDMIPLSEQTGERTEMYCRCPPGYLGLDCEIALKSCGTGGMCSYGSLCLESEDDFGDTYQHCGCDVLKSEFLGSYTEHLCEYATLFYCSEEAPSRSYCANGGVCNDVVGAQDPHAGCDCPLGWEGPHCEFVDRAYMELHFGDTDDKKSILFATGITCAVLGVMGLVAGTYAYYSFVKPSNRPEVSTLDLEDDFAIDIDEKHDKHDVLTARDSIIEEHFSKEATVQMRKGKIGTLRAPPGSQII